jgi:hypothetical protein
MNGNTGIFARKKSRKHTRPDPIQPQWPPTSLSLQMCGQLQADRAGACVIFLHGQLNVRLQKLDGKTSLNPHD